MQAFALILGVVLVGVAFLVVVVLCLEPRADDDNADLFQGGQGRDADDVEDSGGVMVLLFAFLCLGAAFGLFAVAFS